MNYHTNNFPNDLIDPIKEAINEDNTEKLEELISTLDNIDSTLPIELPFFGSCLITMLHLCCCLGSTNCAKMLMEKNADINKTDEFGRSCIHFAASRSLDMINIMLNENQVRKTDCKGLTPAHYAAIFNQNDIIKKLLIKGYSAEKSADNYGRRPIHLACIYGNVDIIKLLIEYEIEDCNTSQLIFYACMSRKCDVIQYLIEKGADINSISNNKTPLYIAAKSGNLSAVKLLLDNQAKFKTSDEDYSPLVAAINYDHLDIVNYFLQKGYDPNDHGKYEQSPLKSALDKSTTKFAELLIKHGAVADPRTPTQIKEDIDYSSKSIPELYEIIKLNCSFAEQKSPDLLIQASKVNNPYIFNSIFQTENVDQIISEDTNILQNQQDSTKCLLKRLKKGNAATESCYIGVKPNLKSSCDVFNNQKGNFTSKNEINDEDDINSTDQIIHEQLLFYGNNLNHIYLKNHNLYLKPNLCKRYILCYNAIQHDSVEMLHALLENNLYPPESTDLYIAAAELNKIEHIKCMLNHNLSFDPDNENLYKLICNINNDAIMKRFKQNGMEFYTNEDENFLCNNTIQMNFE